MAAKIHDEKFSTQRLRSLDRKRVATATRGRRVRVLDLLGLVDPRRARGRIDENAMIAEAKPELVILHYDNHHPPQAPWQLFDVSGFDSSYVVPRSPVPLPECFRVRRDVLQTVEARLARMPLQVRHHVETMNRYLEKRRPDGKVWEKLASQVDSPK